MGDMNEYSTLTGSAGRKLNNNPLWFMSQFLTGGIQKMNMMKNIRDNIHGDLPFSDLELNIMDTTHMQRLRGIRQLGTSHLVYPGAIHTRFEHSLGTCFVAKKIMSCLEENGSTKISRKDRKAIPAAALLHDITHIPFGHTFEDERKIFSRHDTDPQRLRHFIESEGIGDRLLDEGILDRVLELLEPDGMADSKEIYPRQIISHTICADLLDYIRRDARFCGLSIDFDDRIYRYFQIEDGKLILNLQKGGLFRHDAFSEVIHLLRIRYFLTERVYYHHAKISAGAMLSRAVERVVTRGFKVQRLYNLSDDALVFLLLDQFGSDRTVRRLIESYCKRALYKRCYVLTEHHLEPEKQLEFSQKYHLDLKGARGKAERSIARAAKIPQEAVIIYAPPPKMNLKEAQVLVKVDTKPARPLDDWKNR